MSLKEINYSIYKITNIITNDCYIGADTYFPSRIKEHKSKLLKNKHPNKHLQASFNKYGEGNFIFELLEKCNNREEMLLLEIKHIAEYDSMKNGFNQTIGGEGSFGYKHSEESLKKMSEWKRVVTEEWGKNSSRANLGKKHKKKHKIINKPNYSKWLGGEKHPVSKLTQKEVDEIREKYLSGISQMEMAKEYSVSNIQINNIIHGYSWGSNEYIFNKIDLKIKCVEDCLFFKNTKEISDFYSVLQTSISNNINGLSKTVKTKFGKRTFVKTLIN